MKAIQATRSLYQASLVLSYLFLSCAARTGQARELTETKVISYLRPVTDAQAETKITTGITAASLASGLEHRASSTYAYSLLNTASENDPIETSTTSPEVDDTTAEEIAQDEEGMLNVSLVEQVLFPEEVLLKAHSSLSLEEYYADIFAETATFLTSCLDNVYSDFLQAYKLTVEYNEGPDASDLGVVVTNMNVSVALSVLVDSEEIGSFSQDNATAQVLSGCFTTSKLYQFLGALRLAGISVNELTLQDEDFISPIFDSDESASVDAVEGPSSGSNTNVENKKSRVGLFMGLFGGLLVLGSVFFAQERGMPRPHSDSMGNVGKRIRTSLSVGKLKLESFSDNVKAKFLQARESEDTNSSSLGEEESWSGTSTRERTWSGSYRRHPTGGVKPAALQKTPAFSKDFLKSPVQDDFSFSVGGDYNVPDQYDFQATPMSSLYNTKIAALNKQRGEEEFSMPDEYTSVREDASSSNVASLKSQSPPGVKIPMPYNSYKGYGQHLSSPQGQPAPVENSPNSSWSLPTTYSAAVTSSKEPQNIDEWSVNSFSTSTPVEDSTKADGSPVPYRHWSPSQSRGSPGSLAMPKLR